MTKFDNTRYTSHHEVSKLLPWYVNACLDKDEARLVESHLEICLHCRTEATQQRRLSECIKRSDVRKLASQSSFLRLKERIQHQDCPQTLTQRNQRTVVGASATVKAWFKGFEPKYRAALVLAVMLIVLPLLAVNTVFVEKLQRPEYRTLADPDRRASLPNDIRIVFANGVGQLKKNKILTDVGARIIEGPSPKGIIRIRVEDQESDRLAMITALSSLRQRPDVVFAEPALAITTQPGSGNMRK